MVFLVKMSSANAQVKIKDDKAGKFTLLKVGKLQNSLEDAKVKHLSQGVIIKVGEMEIHADSAVIYVDANRFEAFGNIECYKNGTKNFTSQRVYYRAESRHIMFMDDISTYNKDGTVSKLLVPSIEFDVTD